MSKPYLLVALPCCLSKPLLMFQEIWKQCVVPAALLLWCRVLPPAVLEQWQAVWPLHTDEACRHVSMQWPFA